METHVNLIFYTFSHLNGMSILVKDDGAEWKKECGFEYHLLIFFLQLLIKIKYISACKTNEEIKCV